MKAIYILWLRELKRYSRSKAQIATSLGQPLLYLLVLGYGLSPIFRRSGEGSYLQFMAPGVITLTVLSLSMFSGASLLWDRQFGVLRETLVAPVPRIYIMIGRTFGSASTALLQGLLVGVVCVLAGFRPLSLQSLPLALVFLVLIAVVFTAIGTAIGSTLKDMQTFQMVTNLLVAPLFFLSGALFPLDDVPAALKFAAALDPLSYGVDGFRGALIGEAHFGMKLCFAVLSVLGIVMLSAGAWRFAKMEA